MLKLVCFTTETTCQNSTNSKQSWWRRKEHGRTPASVAGELWKSSLTCRQTMSSAGSLVNTEVQTFHIPTAAPGRTRPTHQTRLPGHGSIVPFGKRQQVLCNFTHVWRPNGLGKTYVLWHLGILPFDMDILLRRLNYLCSPACLLLGIEILTFRANVQLSHATAILTANALHTLLVYQCH